MSSADATKELIQQYRDMRESLYPRGVDGLRADYSAGKPNRFRRRRTGLGGSGDAHIANPTQFELAREYVRDMDRNDAIPGAIVNTAVEQQLSTGFRNTPMTGDDAINEELRLRWEDWAGDPQQCDHHWERTYWQQCWFRWRSTYFDGDISSVLLDSGAIQTMEADRLVTPTNTRRNVVHGILLDERRRKMQFWFAPDSGMRRVQRVGDVKKIDAYDDDGHPQVLHLYFPRTVKRTSQTRGMTVFSPVIDRLSQYDDIQFALLVQRQIVASMAWFLERTAAYQGGTTRVGPHKAEDDATTGVRDLEEIAPGSIVRGKKGEILKNISSQIPNPEYFPHVRLILQEVGINLGLPLVMVLMDASETNFSGWRGAVDQARRGFRVNQKWFCERELIPVYRWKVRQWLATPVRKGGLGQSARAMGDRIFRHRWGMPGWPYIQPLQDVQADLAKLGGLLASPEMVVTERGSSWVETYTEGIDNWEAAIRYAKARALEINKDIDDGHPVHWREVMNWMVNQVLQSDTMKAALEADRAEQQQGSNN